jgi:hypothetical protein
MNTFHKAFKIMRKRGKLARLGDYLTFSTGSIPHDEFDALYKALNASGFDVKVWGSNGKLIIQFK